MYCTVLMLLEPYLFIARFDTIFLKKRNINFYKDINSICISLTRRFLGILHLSQASKNEMSALTATVTFRICRLRPISLRKFIQYCIHQENILYLVYQRFSISFFLIIVLL
jgi:hypothetical protein